MYENNVSYCDNKKGFYYTKSIVSNSSHVLFS